MHPLHDETGRSRLKKYISIRHLNETQMHEKYNNLNALTSVSRYKNVVSADSDQAGLGNSDPG